MQKFTTWTGTLLPLPLENVDTDQIIPARYLTTVSREGLGKGLFQDWRYNSDGSLRPDFPLNNPRYHGATILLAGHNFGCGSSREHAPWAISDFGFKAVISSDFADIFRNNSLRTGLLPIVLKRQEVERLMALAETEPEAAILIDLPNQVVVLPSEDEFHFDIDLYRKLCLVQGLDDLGYMLSKASAISAYEDAHGQA